MTKRLQAIRGMNDILPEESRYWQYLERTIRTLAKQYGYGEIRFPIMEKTELFKRSVGEVTDIVAKEMYTFEDRNGDSLTLRPEGTAGCVRAAMQNGLLHNKTPKLWYTGPLFRYERPQKGRYRQFHQVGFEAFGIQAPELDVEMILLNANLWHRLGIADTVRLELNTLGNPEERSQYRKRLVNYYESHRDQLDQDSQDRLYTNPMRILDSKNPDMKSLNDDAPKLLDHLGEQSRSHFERVCALLERAGVDYTVNPSLVRGLDYYTHTVFEWITEALGAQGTISGGGRYDGLVEQLGGKPTPAVGFAMGIERIMAVLTELDCLPEPEMLADVYFVVQGDAALDCAMELAEVLRTRGDQLKVMLNYQNTSFKSQFKQADQSGARVAIVLGDQEVKEQQATVKYLRSDKPQETVAFSKVADHALLAIPETS